MCKYKYIYIYIIVSQNTCLWIGQNLKDLPTILQGILVYTYYKYTLAVEKMVLVHTEVLGTGTERRAEA